MWTSAFPDARRNVKKYFGKARPGRNAIKGLSIKSWINKNFKWKLSLFFLKKISKFWSHLHMKSNVVISKNYENKPLDYANEGANECSVAKWRGHYGGIFGTLCWRPCLKRTRERLFARRSRPWLVLTQWNLGVVNESRREFDWQLQIHGNAVGVAVIDFVI